ncbi:MAG: GIY-YIG nuclease family protein [Chitinophagales bacterium]|nr:GIY-YIG nuclease family protein [Chitinophagales bacterium]MCZ2459129.1 GIY-YIG nuclease family protein [Chitinophagales bacterium]
MPATVYILYSVQLNKFYVGSTAGPLEDRLRRHRSKHKGFTGSVSDWEVVYWETFHDKSAALKREKEIKNWKSSIRIKELISKSEKSIPI